MFVEERGKRGPHLLSFSSLGVRFPSDDGDYAVWVLNEAGHP